MKNVQISKELFVAIMRYFMLEQEGLLPQIKQGGGEEAGCNGNEIIIYKI